MKHQIRLHFAGSLLLFRTFLIGIFLCLLPCCGVLSSFAQRQTGLFHTPQKRAVRFRAMEWNVENLYDTLHDEGFADEEFLPTAERRWNTPRYLHKQASLAKTILAPADCNRWTWWRFVRWKMTVWCIFSATVPGLRASATTTWSRTAQIGAASTSLSYINPRLLRICIAKRAACPTTLRENVRRATCCTWRDGYLTATPSMFLSCISRRVAEGLRPPSLIGCAQHSCCVKWPTASRICAIVRYYWPWATSTTNRKSFYPRSAFTHLHCAHSTCHTAAG